MLGSSMGMGMAPLPELHPDVRGVQKKNKMTNFTMPNNISSKKYAVKSVPGLADVGVLPLDEVIAGFGSDLAQIEKIHAYHLDQHKKLKGLDA